MCSKCKLHPGFEDLLWEKEYKISLFFYINYILYLWYVRYIGFNQIHDLNLISPVSFPFFLNVATRKFTVACAAHILFLLGSTGLKDPMVPWSNPSPKTSAVARLLENQVWDFLSRQTSLSLPWYSRKSPTSTCGKKHSRGYHQYPSAWESPKQNSLGH